jgi:hypothetical protein
MESPLRFQAVTAVLLISGAVVLADEPPAVPEPAFTFQDAAIDESSGLLDLGSTVATVNDSGAGPVVHLVDSETGRTVGRTTYTTDEVVDVEALAAGPDGSVWVGDIGDNSAHRMSVAVYRLPEVTPGDRTVESQRYDLQYRGGPRDAEALLVDPRDGRLHVVSKGLFGGEVFVAPEELRTDRPNLLRPVGRTSGMVTDGAFFPDGRHVLLRSYSRATVYDSAQWRSPAGMRLPDQRQGEGLAMAPTGDRVLVSTEGAGSKVLTVRLGADILTAVAQPAVAEPVVPGSADSEPAREPGPAESGYSGQTVAALGAAFGVRAIFRARAVRAARPRGRSSR